MIVHLDSRDINNNKYIIKYVINNTSKVLQGDSREQSIERYHLFIPL